MAATFARSCPTPAAARGPRAARPPRRSRGPDDGPGLARPPRPGPAARAAPVTGPGCSGARRSSARAAVSDLDGQHAAQPVHGPAQLAGRMPAQRDVVLLHRRGRDRIDRRRHGQPLAVRRRSRPGCTGRSCARSPPRPRGPGTAAAHGIAPGPASGRCAARRCEATSATEIARKSSTAATGAPWKLPLDSTRPSASTTGLSIAEASSRPAISAAWSDGVPRRAVHRRRAPQRVGVLDPGVLRTGMRRDDRRTGQRRRDPGGASCLARLRPQGLQVRREHPVGAQQRLDAHRSGQVGDVQQPGEVVQRQHQHAEHAVGAVDQRQSFLLGQHHRRQPGGGQGGRRRAGAARRRRPPRPRPSGRARRRPAERDRRNSPANRTPGRAA